MRVHPLVIQDRWYLRCGRPNLPYMNDMPPEFFEHEEETEFERDPTSPVFTDDLTDLDDD